MEKEELEKKIETYILYYYEIKQKFDLYKYIKENSQIYSSETQTIAFFLQTVLNSLLTNVLLDISKIVDKRNNKNIFKLINVCNQNSRLFTNNEKERRKILERLDDMKEEMESKIEIIENLKTYRDKYLAHIDKGYFLNSNKLFLEYETSYDDIELILDIIVKICNELLSRLCDTTYAFNDEYKNNYKYILECIRECRENEIKQYENMQNTMS